MVNPMTPGIRKNIGVSERTYELMNSWKARVEAALGIAPQSWDQFFLLWAKSEKMP